MRENEEGKKKGREEEGRKEKRREMNGEREGQGEEGRKEGNKKKFQLQKLTGSIVELKHSRILLQSDK